MGTVTLKPGREKAVLRYLHPWIYSGAVQRTDEVSAEELTEVHDSSGVTLGWGYYSPSSLIAVRMISHGVKPPGSDWLEQRLKRAHQMRQQLSIDSGLRAVLRPIPAATARTRGLVSSPTGRRVRES